MSLGYGAVGWNRQKRIYDLTLAAGVLLYLVLFVGVSSVARPNATIETLLIRGMGTGAFFLLHVVLSIGPLCRLDRRFLPLLYNRRHLGVTTFTLGLGHAAAPELSDAQRCRQLHAQPSAIEWAGEALPVRRLALAPPGGAAR